MNLTKSQLQFFFDEVLEKFGWSEEIEETTVDPLDYVLDEINNTKRHVVNVEKQNKEIRLILLDQSRVIEQFQKLLGVETATSAFAKVAVLMREESEIEVELNKYKKLVNSIYETVSVNCSDIGETFAGMQSDIEELRKETFPANVENAKWSGHYETCPANNGGSCTC